MRRSYLMAGFLVWIALGSQSSEAQYTADFQTNIISGVTSNWSGPYYVGNTTFADALLIQNNGVLADADSHIGYSAGSSNNIVLVSGIGSIWTNDLLHVGVAGVGNGLVISNGGRVFSGTPAASISGIVGVDPGSSSNTVVVSDANSAWNNFLSFCIGYAGNGNSMVITNGGQVADRAGTVGADVSGSNNSVLVTGSGSVWSNSEPVTIGNSGAGNSLVISGGGLVLSASNPFSSGLVAGSIGSQSGSVSNRVLVTDPGSTWNNDGTLIIGNGGNASTLVISNSGQVVDSIGMIGFNPGSSNNSAIVTGSGSVWSNGLLYVGNDGAWNSLVIGLGCCGGTVISSNATIGSYVTSSSNSVHVDYRGVWRNNTLIVGDQGSSNSLRIGDGSVFATNLVVGATSTTCDNLVEVDVSGNLIVTNATGTGLLEIRHGELILNGGTLRADTLVMTNSCAQFVHTGGTLIVSNLVLDPNMFRIVSIAPQTNDLLVTWMMGPGATNTLQSTVGDGNGGYNTSGFTDIFVVTNNTSVGTVTNYLDSGAATNTRARYYRARLVP